MPGKRFQDNSMRLAKKDYSDNAAYFVTICCKNRIKYFGSCDRGVLKHSEIGKLAHNHIIDIPIHFPYTLINSMIVMPEHLHMLIVIKHNAGTLHATSQQNDGKKNNAGTLHATSQQYDQDKNQVMSGISPKAGSLSIIIRSYKSAVTKMARSINQDFEWQARYHDRIIRNRYEFIRVQKYIVDNPVMYKGD